MHGGAGGVKGKGSWCERAGERAPRTTFRHMEAAAAAKNGIRKKFIRERPCEPRLGGGSARRPHQVRRDTHKNEHAHGFRCCLSPGTYSHGNPAHFAGWWAPQPHFSLITISVQGPSLMVKTPSLSRSLSRARARSRTPHVDLPTSALPHAPPPPTCRPHPPHPLHSAPPLASPPVIQRRFLTETPRVNLTEIRKIKQSTPKRTPCPKSL